MTLLIGLIFITPILGYLVYSGIQESILDCRGAGDFVVGTLALANGTTGLIGIALLLLILIP